MSTASVNVQAATLTVTSTADSGPGSLRAVLKSARNGDTINFAVTGTILLTGGELLVSKNVKILGPGAGNLALNGNHATRVFRAASGTTTTIAGLTVTNGYATGRFSLDMSGGGIYNESATLTVSNCVIAGNAAAQLGGGIFNRAVTSHNTPRTAALTVVNCTLSANSAGSQGGGLYNSVGTGSSATMTVLNSTFSGNTSLGGGGGIANEPGGTVTVRNCTLSGNLVANAGFGGGGIENFGGVVTVTSSTLTGNSVNGGYGYGGGIWTQDGTVTVGNSILNNIGRIANVYISPFGAGTVTSLGYNLSANDFQSIVLTNATDRFGNPLLGPLQDNGGPTWTHAPQPGSPAIDRGKNFSGSTTDQRGFARTYDDPAITNATGGDSTDIGAVEVQPVTLSATPTNVVTVEGSNDGTAWTPVTTINLSEGATYVPDSEPMRLYRVRVQ